MKKILISILASLMILLSASPAFADYGWDGASHSQVVQRPLDGVGDSPIMP